MLNVAERVKLMNDWFISGLSFLCGECPVDMLYNLVLVTSIVFGTYFEILGANNPLEFLTSIGLVLLVWTMVDMVFRFYFFHKGCEFACRVLYICEFFIIGLGVPCYFYAVALSIYKRPYYDQALINVDTFLLGWAFPSGQVSLYADRSMHLHPQTMFGKVYSEVLQIAYMSYYVWPYLVASIPAVKCFLSLFKNRFYQPSNTKEEQKNWHEFKLVLSIWALSYLLTFLINSLIPASSPRLFLAEEYTHEITGFGLAKMFQGVAKENRSANSFPSGHVAETLSAALTALFVLGHQVLGGVMLGTTALLILGTVVLRYHYFADAIVGALIGIVAVSIGLLVMNRKFTFQTKRCDDVPSSQNEGEHKHVAIEMNTYEKLDESDESFVSVEISNANKKTYEEPY